MGFKKKSSARKAHGGIRLSKLPDSTVAANTTKLSTPAAQHQHQHVVQELDPAFAYSEIPDEVLVGNELDLSVTTTTYQRSLCLPFALNVWGHVRNFFLVEQLWSVVAQDSCLARLGGDGRREIKSLRTLVSGSASSTHARPRSGSPRRAIITNLSASNQIAEFVVPATGALGATTTTTPRRQLAVAYLNLAGAESVRANDQGTHGRWRAALSELLPPAPDAQPQLRDGAPERRCQHDRRAPVALAWYTHAYSLLTMHYGSESLQYSILTTLWLTDCFLIELGLAGCTKVPEFALQRVFHACETLEKLDLSFCGAVSDQLLLSLGQHCHKLEQLKLRGCRQISDAGVVGFVNAGGSELVLLDLTRFDLQYKLNDIALLSLAERSPLLQTLVLTGCDMLTDVGLSWLCSGCPALTHVDVSGCAKLTDLSLRSIGENLLQLQHLNINHCVRVSDLGIRHLSLGCPDLTRLDAVGLTLLADPRPHDVDSHGGGDGGDGRYFQGIAALAVRCVKLRHLDISRCPSIGDGTLHYLATKSRELAELNVSSCARVTHAGVRQLLSSATKLTTLSVSDCEKVSDRAFAGLLISPETHGDNVSSRCRLEPELSLSRLVSLRLKNCLHVSDATLKSLSALQVSLRELDLSGCARISDMGVLVLSDSSMAPSLRYLWLRDLVEITETGLSWLAEKCRKLLLLDLTGCSKIQSFSIKSLAGYWKFAAYAKNDHFKGLAPKHRAEDWLFIEEYGDCWRSATRIQCMYRARVARRIANQKREEKLILWVATRLQSVYRGRQARKYAILKRLQFNKETAAASQIQAKFRQRKATREVEKLRNERRNQQLHQAARFIQSAWRRKRLRDRLQARTIVKVARQEQLHRAAVKLQRVWRGKRSRMQSNFLTVAKVAKDREEHEAANKMQNLFRARAARREVIRKRQELHDEELRREQAAMRVQAHVRRRRAQRELAARMMFAKRMNDAATRIQRRWRAKKQWFASQLIVVARHRREEYAAAVKLQSAWKRKQGRLEAKLLRLVREKEQQRVVQAALQVQTHWRAKRARVQVSEAKQLAMEKLLIEMKMQHHAAALVQAHFRGRRGRERYREMVLLKKKRWKEVVHPENGQKFYYNKETGEVRFRRPQDVLDLLSKPLCDNCVSPATHIAQVECKDCAEMFCNTCWHNVHAGGKRRLHEFRALYDFYEKRVDYGDGEFPSKWPSEVEQDEMDGWALRMYPRRQPVEVKGFWEKYVDTVTSKEWFYNKETEASRYSPPSEFQQPFEPSSSLDQQSPLVTDWTKYYDETQGLEYYYNSKTLECTFSRPANFVTARLNPSATDTPLASGREGWEKYVDPESGYPYYYNSKTAESTFARPANFQTARRGNVTIETGGNDWAKYYDLSQGVYYYYNARTFESSFARPLEFATPRIAPTDAGAMGMSEFYDPATAKAYFFNAQTAECQLAASGMATVRGGRHDYR